MRALLLFTLLMLCQSAAHAEWIQASSPHFVIYANASPSKIQGLSQELERYHSAMAYVSDKESPAPSPSNRLTIYMVENEYYVRELYVADGTKRKDVGGFYVPRAGSSFAIVPLAFIDTRNTNFDYAKFALLHEYAHHFMMSENAFAMPRWYAEGGAEFFASAKFWPDGGVSIGRPVINIHPTFPSHRLKP